MHQIFRLSVYNLTTFSRANGCFYFNVVSRKEKENGFHRCSDSIVAITAQPQIGVRLHRKHLPCQCPPDVHLLTLGSDKSPLARHDHHKHVYSVCMCVGHGVLTGHSRREDFCLDQAWMEPADNLRAWTLEAFSTEWLLGPLPRALFLLQ